MVGLYLRTLNIDYLATSHPETDEFNFMINTLTWTSMTFWGLHPVGIHNIMLVIVAATLSIRFLQGNDILGKAACSLEFRNGFIYLVI